MSCDYPIFLDVSERLIVIVGGGAVASRKAAGLLAAGAKRVRCVAPEFHPDLPEAVQRVKERYAPQHLQGASLVFAATDDAATNAAIAKDARAAGAWVSRADAEEGPGDFSVPAVYRDGSLTVAVSAGGAPAVATAVRDGIAKVLDARYARLADAMNSLRPLVLRRVADPLRRRQIFHDLAGDGALQASCGGAGELQRWIAQRYPELNHV